MHQTGKLLSRWNLITYLVALVIILAINFLLPRMMPGDPLMAIYGEDALVQMTPELKEHLVERFALDEPLWEQLGAYFWGLVQGDWGYSYYYNAPVSSVVAGRLPWTILLVGSALVLSTGLGIILGIESAWRREKRLDRSLLTGLMTLGGFPDFFLGMLFLLFFGVTLGIFPLSGALTPYSDLSGLALVLDVLKHLCLPLLALTLCHIGGGYLLTRNTMIGVIREPYILTAKAKGLTDARIRYSHAGRNSMLPVVTRTGIWLARLVTGTFFV
ncbi:MAG: ABC transporter permease, partial [Dehalococcoidia bacterium]